MRARGGGFFQSARGGSGLRRAGSRDRGQDHAERPRRPCRPKARGPDGWRQRVERPAGGGTRGARTVACAPPRPPRTAPGPRPRPAAGCVTRVAGGGPAVPGPASTRRGRERAKPGERPRERNWPGKGKEEGDGARWLRRALSPAEGSRGPRAREGEDVAVQPGPPEGLPRPSSPLGWNGGAGRTRAAGRSENPRRTRGNPPALSAAVRTTCCRSIYTPERAARPGPGWGWGAAREAPPHSLPLRPPAPSAPLGAPGPPTLTGVRRSLPGGGIG